MGGCWAGTCSGCWVRITDAKQATWRWIRYGPSTLPCCLGSGRIDASGGPYDAQELFAAVQMPLLHDRPWARDMALNIGLRWSDFSSFDSHTTWQAGLRWQPAEELTLRANYGEVFRAPSLARTVRATVLPRSIYEFDPCGNDPTPTQQANCAANGVPGGAYVQDDCGFIVLFGGNPRLEPETGHSFGAGLIYTPLWAKGLSASVDYFQENHTNYISGAHPDQILLRMRGARHQ